MNDVWGDIEGLDLIEFNHRWRASSTRPRSRFPETLAASCALISLSTRFHRRVMGIEQLVPGRPISTASPPPVKRTS
jgi:hypothetical protein